MTEQELTRVLAEAGAQSLELFAEDLEQNVVPKASGADKATILAVCIRARRSASEIRVKIRSSEAGS